MQEVVIYTFYDQISCSIPGEIAWAKDCNKDLLDWLDENHIEYKVAAKKAPGRATTRRQYGGNIFKFVKHNVLISMNDKDYTFYKLVWG